VCIAGRGERRGGEGENVCRGAESRERHPHTSYLLGGMADVVHLATQGGEVLGNLVLDVLRLHGAVAGPLRRSECLLQCLFVGCHEQLQQRRRGGRGMGEGLWGEEWRGGWLCVTAVTQQHAVRNGDG